MYRGPRRLQMWTYTIYVFLSYCAVEVGECWSKWLVQEWREGNCISRWGATAAASVQRGVWMQSGEIVTWMASVKQIFPKFQNDKGTFLLAHNYNSSQQSLVKSCGLRVTCLFRLRLLFKRNQICIFSRATYKEKAQNRIWKDQIPCDLFTLPINKAIWVTWGKKVISGPFKPAVWTQL